jgi:mRNA-degrading endonuclease RelE of RelBE toxin-antitoxin system
VYEVEIRRTALKDLKDIPADYTRLITKHIDLLEQKPAPKRFKEIERQRGFFITHWHISRII